MNKSAKLRAWRSWFSRSKLFAVAQKPRVKKTAITLLGLFILYTASLFFAGPPLLKYYLSNHLAQQLGRKITVGPIHVNPLELSVTIQNFNLAETDGKTPFVSFRELYVNAQLASVVFFGPVLRDIRLTEPRVNLQRKPDESYNFQDLITKLSPTSPVPAETADNNSTPSFSLNNIQIISGQVDFDDQPLKRKHQVRELQVSIPFLSNLFYQIDDYVQPLFSAVVNGAQFSLSGKSKPFDVDRESTFNLRLAQLKLGPYLRYVPKQLSFTLPAGTLSADLSFAFLQAPKKAPTLIITGSADLHDLALDEAKDVPTLRLKHLALKLHKLELLRERFAIDSISASDGALYVRRDENGRLNLANLVEPDDQKSKPLPWFNIKQVSLENFVLHVRDAAVPRPFETRWALDRVSATDLSSEKNRSSKVVLNASGPDGATLKADTELVIQPLRAQGQLALTGLALKSLSPYYEPHLDLHISQGLLGLGAKFAFSSAAPKSKTPATVFNLSELGVQIADLKARKTGDKADLVQLGRLTVKDGTLDLGKRSITLGSVDLNQAQLNLLRDRGGNLNVAQLLRPSGKAEATKVTAPANKTAQTQWQYAINKIVIDDSALRMQDASVPRRAVDLRLDKVQLQADGFSSANKPIKLALKAQFERTGRISVEGLVNPQTPSVDLLVDARALPILPIQPYFADQVQLTVSSGHVSARGKLQGDFGAKPVVRYQGNAQVQQFASVDQLNKNAFLNWEDLSFNGVHVVSAPLSVNIEEIALNQFFSRLIVNADGTLNVQHIVGDRAKSAAGEGTKAPPADVKKATPATQAQTELPIKIGRVTLKEGKVNFSDRFIKPNYSANLTNIGGEITDLSAASTANIALRGEVDNVAPLDIQGKVKPLSGNLFLDLAASVKGVDLPSTTPYSARYAGYPIIKGKLSMDVKYHIENKKLTAENRVMLDQLTFGKRVESPDATKLPVLLAVALLRDRNGVIDINLPISGSLDDPEFSIGGIIGRVIANLLGKALASPFDLLGSLFPNSEELSYIEFEAGLAHLDSNANIKIQSLAQALEQRPALKLDITGRVDLLRDKKALRRLSMERKLKKVKLEGLNPQRRAATKLEDIQFAPGEYSILLKEAYGREKFNKPRNQLGIAKDLPVAEMEQLMLDNIKIGDAELRQLALLRARAVADALSKSGKVSNTRVFVLAPNLNAEPIEKLKDSRVDFSLK